MSNLDYIYKVLECMEFIDDHLSSDNYDTLYEFCCLKFGEHATGVAAYSLLVLRLSKYEKV